VVCSLWRCCVVRLRVVVLHGPRQPAGHMTCFAPVHPSMSMCRRCLWGGRCRWVLWSMPCCPWAATGWTHVLDSPPAHCSNTWGSCSWPLCCPLPSSGGGVRAGHLGSIQVPGRHGGRVQQQRVCTTLMARPPSIPAKMSASAPASTAVPRISWSGQQGRHLPTQLSLQALAAATAAGLAMCGWSLLACPLMSPAQQSNSCSLTIRTVCQVGRRQPPGKESIHHPHHLQQHQEQQQRWLQLPMQLLPGPLPGSCKQLQWGPAPTAPVGSGSMFLPRAATR
jgi:hypothetical protein